MVFVTVVALLIVTSVVLANLDFNRMGKEHVFVQLTDDPMIEESKLDSGDLINRYWYTLPAYTSDGELIEVEFSSGRALKQDAYLKLYMNNGSEVTSYDEVTFEELPVKLQEAAQNN